MLFGVFRNQGSSSIKSNKRVGSGQKWGQKWSKKRYFGSKMDHFLNKSDPKKGTRNRPISEITTAKIVDFNCAFLTRAAIGVQKRGQKGSKKGQKGVFWVVLGGLQLRGVLCISKTPFNCLCFCKTCLKVEQKW